MNNSLTLFFSRQSRYMPVVCPSIYRVMLIRGHFTTKGSFYLKEQ